MGLNVQSIVKEIKQDIQKNTPQILTGLGIGGMLTSIVLAVKATPKAMCIIEEERHKRNDAIIEYNNALSKHEGDMETRYLPLIEQLPPKEAIRVAWRCYLPTAAIAATSVVCLIGSASVNSRRNTALAAAYKLSETAFTEYQNKVIELEGDQKHQEIREAVAKDKIENHPVNDQPIIVGSGDTLCYDTITGQYFKSTIDKIDRAANKLNRYMVNNMYVSLNDFYDELGLDHVKIGDELGWVVDKGLIDIWYSAQITDDNQACVVINYDVEPRIDYYKSH